MHLPDQHQHDFYKTLINCYQNKSDFDKQQIEKLTHYFNNECSDTTMKYFVAYTYNSLILQDEFLKDYLYDYETHWEIYANILRQPNLYYSSSKTDLYESLIGLDENDEKYDEIYDYDYIYDLLNCDNKLDIAFNFTFYQVFLIIN